MGDVSRRVFLKQMSAAAAVGGVVSATSMPLISGLLSSPEAAGAGAEIPAAGAELPASATLSEPLVAHVQDLTTGEISVFKGAQQFTYHDPQLAARIFNAAR